MFAVSEFKYRTYLLKRNVLSLPLNTLRRNYICFEWRLFVQYHYFKFILRMIYCSGDPGRQLHD